MHGPGQTALESATLAESVSAPEDTAVAGRVAAIKAWLRDRGLWLGILLSILACLPVLVAATPQMTDYPSHLAGFKIMLAHGADPWLTRYFTFEWEWTGNLGAELLMVPLTPIFGLEQSGRLIVLMIPLLTGLGIVAVSRALRREVSVGAVLAFSLIWSPSLLMGFLNYTLSIAFGLLAFALWIRMEGHRWRPAVFLPIGFIVWLSHVSGWGVLGVMVFGYEWSRRKSWLDWRPFLAPWPLIFPLFPMLLTLGGDSDMSYGRSVWDYKWGILYKAMRSYYYVFDVVCVSIMALVVLAAIVTRRFDGRMGWAALGLLFLTLAVPRHIFGGDYADYRLSTAALMLACLAMKWPAKRWAMVLAAAFFLVRLSITTQSWYVDGRISREMLAALEHVPDGAKVATAVAIPRRLWRFGPYEHLGSYAVVRRGAMENSNFALPGVHMLAMRNARIRFADPSQRVLYSKGQSIDLRRFRPAKYADYLWYIGTLRPVALPEGSVVLYKTPNSVLARLAKPADPS